MHADLDVRVAPTALGERDPKLAKGGTVLYPFTKKAGIQQNLCAGGRGSGRNDWSPLPSKLHPATLLQMFSHSPEDSPQFSPPYCKNFS